MYPSASCRRLFLAGILYVLFKDLFIGMKLGRYRFPFPTSNPGIGLRYGQYLSSYTYLFLDLSRRANYHQKKVVSQR